MPHIAVRATFLQARHHRQDRLLVIERPNLAFLIDAAPSLSERRRANRSFSSSLKLPWVAPI
jgi:hypothetical protein